MTSTGIPLDFDVDDVKAAWKEWLLAMKDGDDVSFQEFFLEVTLPDGYGCNNFLFSESIYEVMRKIKGHLYHGQLIMAFRKPLSQFDDEIPF